MPWNEAKVHLERLVGLYVVRQKATSGTIKEDVLAKIFGYQKLQTLFILYERDTTNFLPSITKLLPSIKKLSMLKELKIKFLSTDHPTDSFISSICDTIKEIKTIESLKFYCSRCPKITNSSVISVANLCD